MRNVNTYDIIECMDEDEFKALLEETQKQLIEHLANCHPMFSEHRYKEFLKKNGLEDNEIARKLYEE